MSPMQTPQTTDNGVAARKQRRIKKGDQKAGTAVDPRVFLGVSERLAELQEHPSGTRRRQNAYSDNPDSEADAHHQDSRENTHSTRAGGRESIERGGGVPTSARSGDGQRAGTGGVDGLLDLMSMDIGGEGGEGGTNGK